MLSGLEVLERGLVERVVLRCAAGEAAVVKKEGGQKERKEQKEQKKEVDGDVDVDVDVIMGEEDDGEDYRDENQGRDEDGDGDGDKKNEEKAKKPSESQQGLKGERRRPPPPEFYLVRSSQFLNTHPRRKRKKPSSNLVGLGDAADTEGVQPGGSETDRDRDHRIQRYIVSLEAWNCTCAAFAFACVSEEPEVGEAGGDGDEDGEEQGSEELREREKERVRDKQGSAGWTFGGMTLFNPDDHSSVPPVCKHLLACLLADKWRRALGRYVTERMMSREEMAGIVADV